MVLARPTRQKYRKCSVLFDKEVSYTERKKTTGKLFFKVFFELIQIEDTIKLLFPKVILVHASQAYTDSVSGLSNFKFIVV